MIEAELDEKIAVENMLGAFDLKEDVERGGGLLASERYKGGAGPLPSDFPSGYVTNVPRLVIFESISSSKHSLRFSTSFSARSLPIKQALAEEEITTEQEINTLVDALGRNHDEGTT